MIDPYNITNFNRSDEELWEFLIFTIAVAGKTARVIARSVDDFLFNSPESTYHPRATLVRMIQNNSVQSNLRRARTGKYGLLEKSINYIIANKIDLYNSTPGDLDAIPGVGPKTARFFIVHSRPNQNYAVIDTHVTKWLSELGYTVGNIVKEYPQLESYFLAETRARGMTVSDMDLKIWTAYSNKTTLNNIIPHPYTKLGVINETE